MRNAITGAAGGGRRPAGRSGWTPASGVAGLTSFWLSPEVKGSRVKVQGLRHFRFMQHSCRQLQTGPGATSPDAEEVADVAAAVPRVVDVAVGRPEVRGAAEEAAAPDHTVGG